MCLVKLYFVDEKRKIQKDLQIPEYTDPKHDPMIPFTILLEHGLKIYKIYNGYWYWGRPTPKEIRQAFRNISKKVRPDWDLSDPDLKEKWDENEKRFFYPYKK
ncbi:hypothetical protein [Christiangramia sp.]|uniref:hypothetical protein n=1 Tax=Christiangramia sp. TaxID=1931228 RepID=UPI002613F9BA|nr:hypothetical protein [Christiangramia sp.]